jgi:hypothetical protein
VTLNLPAANQVSYASDTQFLWIIKIDSTANAVTITAGAGDTILGQATWTLTVQYAAVGLSGDGIHTWYMPAFFPGIGSSTQVLTSNGTGTQATYQAASSSSVTNTATDASGTTTSSFATVFDISDSNGLHGSFMLKNTDGTNALKYQITVTDLFSTTVTGTIGTITHGQLTTFSFDTSIPSGVTTAAPPYKEVKLEVEDALGGSHATYDCWRSVIG